MSHQPKDYSFHLIGLGGAGANILEECFRHPQILDFLKRPGVKLSCLAVDVADHDVRSLNETYERFLSELRSKGIPKEKVSLIAKTVKFPTPEAMFEFLEKLPNYLRLEGTQVMANYKPWLSSSMDIPPLAGGIGRRRALAKAIYGLNYYHLKLIESYLEQFKESVSSSLLQPVIIVIFGMGGGSGSGMALDFTRHLRRKIGSGFPIIGLGILPCEGDDPAAKGASAFGCMNELEKMLNKEKNQAVKKTYGPLYENPFSAFLTMPLGPPYGKSGNLLDAKRTIDQTIVDIILSTLHFDISDLLSNISANLSLGDRWVHTITSITISYPIDKHVELVKLKLSRLDAVRLLRKEKLELLSGSIEAKTGGVNKILSLVMDDLALIHRDMTIEKGIYDEKNFANQLNEYIYGDHTVEMLFNMQLKGAEDSIQKLLDESLTPIQTIGLDATEGTSEARIKMLVGEIVNIIRGIYSTHRDFHKFRSRIIDDMNMSIKSAQKLTFRQTLLLNDLLELLTLLDDYLVALRKYFEVKTLAEKLEKELIKAEKTDEQQRKLANVQRIQNPELTVIFALLPGIVANPAAELKAVDAHLSEIRISKRNVAELINQVRMDRESLQAKLRMLKNEKETFEQEVAAIKVSFLRSGKKKFLQEKIKEIEHGISSAQMDIAEVDAALQKHETKLSEYTSIEKRFDVNSDYRKHLAPITEMENAFYDMLNEVSKDRGYYNRVAEITEEERLRIMQKIMKEEEDSLTRETILKEIVDRQSLKNYLVSVMRILRNPSTFGVTANYRTDYIWVTIVAPRGVWDKDMDFELKATLSGYISGDVSRCVAVREVDSLDPWTIRFLIIASKARKHDLETYRDMKTLYEQVPKGDALLAHSFLLEHGVIVEENDGKPVDNP